MVIGLREFKKKKKTNMDKMANFGLEWNRIMQGRSQNLRNRGGNRKSRALLRPEDCLGEKECRKYIIQSAKIVCLDPALSLCTHETAVYTFLRSPTFRVRMRFTKKRGMVSRATTLRNFLEENKFLHLVLRWPS